jgi:hypothetical protein
MQVAYDVKTSSKKAKSKCAQSSISSQDRTGWSSANQSVDVGPRVLTLPLYFGRLSQKTLSALPALLYLCTARKIEYLTRARRCLIWKWTTWSGDENCAAVDGAAAGNCWDRSLGASRMSDNIGSTAASTWISVLSPFAKITLGWVKHVKSW